VEAVDFLAIYKREPLSLEKIGCFSDHKYYNMPQK